MNPFTGQPGTKSTPPAGYGTNLGGSLASATSPHADSLYSSGIDEQIRARELERQKLLERIQKSRDYEKSRREKARASIPVKHWTEEELAQSTFKVAHMLYLNGNV